MPDLYSLYNRIIHVLIEEIHTLQMLFGGAYIYYIGVLPAIPVYVTPAALLLLVQLAWSSPRNLHESHC